jgi:release factor glutamine methyltransferase
VPAATGRGSSRSDRPAQAADTDAFARLARRRRNGEPVAYLTGQREFFGLSLAVDPSVLIPRPETETLVECALRKLPQRRASRVLDLGTGTGAIALAIAHERPQARVVAVDRSEALDPTDVGGAPAAGHVMADGIGRRPRRRPRHGPAVVVAGDPHLGEGDVR